MAIGPLNVIIWGQAATKSGLMLVLAMHNNHL
jgi:hypothetical protein